MKKVLLIFFITLMFVSTFVSCNKAPSVVNSEITKPIIETTPKTTVVLTTKKVETKTDKQTTKTVSHSTKAVTTNNKLQDLLKNVVIDDEFSYQNITTPDTIPIKQFKNNYTSYKSKQVKKSKSISGFKYIDYKNGVMIVEYFGKSSEIYIPQKVDNKPVVGIGGFYNDDYDFKDENDKFSSLPNCPAFYKATNLNIPKTVKYIERIYDCKNLQKINVNVDNLYYSSINGMLCSKDKNDLYCVPIKYLSNSNSNRVFSVPEEIKRIGKNAFCNSDFCIYDVVNISKSVKLIEATNALSFNVDKDNKYYVSIDGSLYSKSVNKLIKYSYDGAVNQKKIKLPESIEYIEAKAFYHEDYIAETDLEDYPNRPTAQIPAIKDLYIPNNLKIQKYPFIYLFDGFEHENIIIKDNKNFSTDGKMLFSKDKTVLYYINLGYEKNITIPDEVEIIKNCISYVDLHFDRKIIFGKNIEKIYCIKETKLENDLNATIKGYKGTVAEALAKKTKIKFIALD